MPAPITKLVASALVGALFVLSQPHGISTAEKEQLAGKFSFQKLALADLAQYPHKQVRKVHPSFARLSAWVSATGAAIALADIDNDGLPNDYCQVDPRIDQVIVGCVPAASKRYEPFALNLTQIPAYNVETMAPTSVLVGDVNEDGLADIIVGFWGRTPVAFLRKKTSASKPNVSADDFIASDLVPDGKRWFTDSMCFADLDGDGHQDLIVANYCPDGAHTLDSHGTGQEELYDSISHATNGGDKHFLLFQGGTSGSNPTVKFGDSKTNLSNDVLRGWTTAVAAFDIDGDLLPEVYLANDVGRDRLLHNESSPGKLRFSVLEGKRDLATPKSCVLGQDSFKGMGVDVADINQDGLPDLYVSNIASPYKFLENHFLWLNNGKVSGIAHGIAPFADYSQQFGLSQSGWAWDNKIADFDNDGQPEVVQAMGFIKGKINRWPEIQAVGSIKDSLVHDPRYWPSITPGADISGNETNAFFVKANNGQYYDLAKQIGVAEATCTRGIAVADTTGSGKLDFACGNQWQTSYFFKNNCQNKNAFLGLKLVLPIAKTNRNSINVISGRPILNGRFRPAIGTQAIVHLANGKPIYNQVDGGNGHSGKRSQEIIVGLGKAKANKLPVDLSWRDSSGNVHKQTIQAQRGWQTVELF